MRIGAIHLLFFLFIFFPSFVFSGEEKHCDYIDPWQLSVCTNAGEELSHKFNAFGFLLEESVIRKTAIPEAVKEAGKAVFNIGVQHDYPQRRYLGGSGFFLFDVNTFFTNHHVLDHLLNATGVLDWSKIVFKDQEGNRKNFRVTGVKFISLLHDIAVLSVEGYKGPVLDFATETPRTPTSPYIGHSYMIGYPRDEEGKSQFKIQSVHSAFDVTDIYYGIFPELFDSYSGITNFGGSSGGPMVNRKGEVEAVFSNMVHSELTTSFLLARKMEFLIEKIKNSEKIFHSVQKAKEMTNADKEALVELAQSGNADAQFELFFAVSGLSKDIIKEIIIMFDKLDHVLKQYIWVAGEFNYNIEEIINKNLLHTTWYELGAFLYYDKNDLQRACDFWNRASQLGHPYIYSDFVIMPYKQEIIYCSNKSENENQP